MTWITLCNSDDINDGEMKAFEHGETRAALYRVDGILYATNNVCTHAFALLTDGWLEGLAVECPLHAAQFDISTGEVLCGPAECSLATYPVRVVDGNVQISLEN